MDNYDVTDYGSRNTLTESASTSMIRIVYVWMCGALAITGLTAFFIATNDSLSYFIFSRAWLVIAFIVAELALVIALNALINRINATVATIMFLLYAVINGVTLSVIFTVYELGSIAAAFFITAGTFGAMAVYGAVTKKDLSKWGSLGLMALIGLILASIVNLLIKSTLIEYIVSFIGVIVFVGLTAYDSQKIKAMLYGAEENDTTARIAVIGALGLYLDFVNLFLYILRFFGRRN